MPERKTVVVTGASAGLGRAIVVGFAARGRSRSRSSARGLEGLASAAKEVAAAGGQALAVPTDVSSWAAVDAAATCIEADLGEIDVWVNNAMTSVFAPFCQVEPAEFERVTAVNYLGFVYGTMAALRRMQPRDRGTIVQVGSASALRSIPLQSAYRGSKHAILGFTESLRTELAARSQPGQGDHGADARDEHPAVLLGSDKDAERTAARRADLPTRGRSTRSAVRRRSPRSTQLLRRHLYLVRPCS